MIKTGSFDAFSKENGVSLREFGIAEPGFSRAAALQAIDLLEALGKALVGGDVYRLVDGELVSTPDSWFCDQIAGETYGEFCQRCARTGSEYIRAYPDHSDAVVFTMVLRPG